MPNYIIEDFTDFTIFQFHCLKKYMKKQKKPIKVSITTVTVHDDVL